MPKKKFIFEKIPENAIKLYLTSKKNKKNHKSNQRNPQKEKWTIKDKGILHAKPRNERYFKSMIL